MMFTLFLWEIVLIHYLFAKVKLTQCPFRIQPICNFTDVIINTTIDRKASVDPVSVKISIRNFFLSCISYDRIIFKTQFNSHTFHLQLVTYLDVLMNYLGLDPSPPYIL